MQNRFRYFLIVCLVILLGLISRKIDFVPLFVGDILYAMMIYFIIRFFFLKISSIKIAIIAIIICFTIEFLQLYQSWIVKIRNTTLGHLVLGQGFLWSDLLAYLFGITIIYILDKIIFKKTKLEINL